jgi:hypothetical protein
MKILNYLCYLKDVIHLPSDLDCGKPIPVSKGGLKRWIQDRHVRVNGAVANLNTEVSFPVWDLVFFPGSKRQCTMAMPELFGIGALTPKAWADHTFEWIWQARNKNHNNLRS